MPATKYNDKFAISQSAIKDWKELSPKEWYDKWILKITTRRSSEAMDFGSLVDVLAFTPKNFEKRFIVAEVAKPSDKVVKIVTEVYAEILRINEDIDKIHKETFENSLKKDPLATTTVPVVTLPKKVLALSDENNIDIVKKFCLDNDHYANKPDQAYNDVLKKGTEYFEFLKTVGNKIVVTKQQKETAEELVKILYNDPVSKPFFTPKSTCEVLFQQGIFTDFVIEGFQNVELLPLKGLLDIIHINKKRKEIREVDLKVTQSAFKFLDQVWRFDYAMQHSFYYHLISEWKLTYKKGIYKDFVVMPPLNIVIDETEKLPYLYHYNMSDLMIKRLGFEGTKIKGWEGTLQEIAYHISTNDWSRPLEHIKNGYISVNLFKK
jgi:hypothetical protein